MLKRILRDTVDAADEKLTEQREELVNKLTDLALLGSALLLFGLSVYTVFNSLRELRGERE